MSLTLSFISKSVLLRLPGPQPRPRFLILSPRPSSSLPWALWRPRCLLPPLSGPAVPSPATRERWLGTGWARTQPLGPGAPRGGCHCLPIGPARRLCWVSGIVSFSSRGGVQAGSGEASLGVGRRKGPSRGQQAGGRPGSRCGCWDCWLSEGPGGPSMAPTGDCISTPSQNGGKAENGESISHTQVGCKQ